jgi:hypothetical protein
VPPHPQGGRGVRGKSECPDIPQMRPADPHSSVHRQEKRRTAELHLARHRLRAIDRRGQPQGKHRGNLGMADQGRRPQDTTSDGQTRQPSHPAPGETAGRLSLRLCSRGQVYDHIQELRKQGKWKFGDSSTHRFYLAVADDLVDRARKAVGKVLSQDLLRTCCAPPVLPTQQKRLATISDCQPDTYKSGQDWS